MLVKRLARCEMARVTPSRFRHHFLVTAFVLAMTATLAACTTHPPVASLPAPAARTGPVPTAQTDGAMTLRLSLLTYNVAGLPWPQRSGTRAAMGRIEAAWSAEFGATSPDILVVQEAFVPSSTRLPLRVGYANMVRGPLRMDRAKPLIDPASPAFRRARRMRKGEGVGAVVGSGLLLATDLAIVSNVSRPFGRSSCAGYDCLSNKGVQLVEIAVPGMPEPLFVLNTHLNSRGSTGVSEERSLYAYRRQIREIEALLAREWRGRGPLIWAGDFNARHDPDRFEAKEEHIPGELAHRFCMVNPARCMVRMSWDSDEPWMDTQDLQGFLPGRLVSLEPVEIRARFDRPVDGRMLSDHDGLEVTWELRWPRE